jgi:signal transduction histidine kinase
MRLPNAGTPLKDVRGQNSSLVFDEMTIDLKVTQVGREMLNFFKGNSPQTSILMKGEQRKEWINYCASCSNVLKGYYGHEIPERTYHLVKFSHGYVGAATPGSISNESWSLLRRMTAVFSLAYTRFLDLQRAEAQAREAQIEAALERVRSKTMAMHNSKDVGESVATLFDELTALGLLTSRDRCGIGIMQPDEVMELWTADKSIEKTELTIGHLDMRPHALLRNVYQAWLDRMETFRYTLKGEDKQLYAEAIVNQPRYKIRRDYFSSVENIEHTDFFFEEGCLYVFSEDAISNESASVFSRFVKVFGQTYRRFLDLQNAEKQAREAQIESALEKVRSRTMAMQFSDELADAAYVLFEQLKTLGVTHERINVGIVNEDSHTIDFWITEQGGDKLNTKFSGRISEPTTLSKVYAAWKDGAKSLIVDLQGEELKSWLSYLSDEIKIPFNKSFLHDRRVQTAGFFSKGMIILSSPEPLQYEALYLLEKFAGVFDLTYTRFSDLKLAEAQALQAEKDLIEIKIARQKAEEALDELKSTQSQLIQQEKLASLGQLTAGIAHEIKNPLNFVNNFSSVSVELVDEAIDEVDKIKGGRAEVEGGGTVLDVALAPALALVSDILADIKVNLQKIHEHGSRADGIVKSMLQHSRGGTGKMEPTDLNALVKEFTNLAYHGMRAGKDPIEAEVTIDLDETVGEIPLVYEDFSRVILNICSNAFDAMRGSVRDRGSGIGGLYAEGV